MNDFRTTYGPWALVTGASSGIGAEFALQLAQRGLNLVLVGRRKNLLEEIAADLARRYGTQARALQVDLADPDAVQNINAATRELTIGLLVNNAGAGLPGAFLDHELDNETDIVRVNSVAPMQLAHLFGRKMTKVGRGGIIFVASTLGYVGLPYAANYAATKAYIISLGEALHHELGRKGVDVLVAAPGPTRTPAVNDLPEVDFSQVPMSWMDAEEVVRAALTSLGRQASVIPGDVNNAVYFLVKRILPRDAASSFFGGILERMLRQGT